MPTEAEYNQLRIAEYASLRNELLENERMVLDRIVVIIAAFVVAYYSIRNESLALIYIISLTFIAILWINQYLTIKKVTNNARILAYIYLVHEPKPEIEWIGWEHAIEKYREKKVEYKINNKNGNLTRKKSTDLFYTEIYWASLTAVAIISMLVLFSYISYSSYLSDHICENEPSIYAYGCLAIIIVSTTFGFYANSKKGSKEVYDSINYQKNIWTYTFQNMNN